jgi:hypothetical protein
MDYPGWGDTNNDGRNDALGQCKVTEDISSYTCNWTKETGMVCTKNPQPSSDQQSDEEE